MNENLNVVDARHEGRTEGIAIGEKNAMKKAILAFKDFRVPDDVIVSRILRDYGDKISKDEIIKIFNETK